MRVPLFSRFGGGGALLQIAPIGTYTMSYYLTAKRMSMAAKVARRRRRQRCGAAHRLLPQTDFALDITLLRESPDVMTRFEELTHRVVRNAVRQKKRG